MILRWFIYLSILIHHVLGYPECPSECQCRIDKSGAHLIICQEGDMTSIPIYLFNREAEQIIINGPGNNLTIGPIFNDFNRLKVLRITGSNVPAIGYETFRGCIQLRVLDLSNNNISMLTDDNFLGLKHLVELDLSSNKINRIPSGTFRHLTGLHKLNLADNEIEELVTRQFYMLKKLKFLDLSNNPIKNLPSEIFSDIPFLTKFYCRNCLLNDFNSKLLRIFDYLLELDFGDNMIEHIKRGDLNDMQKLKKLTLDGNKIKEINEYVFEFLGSLEHLDLSRNEINKITNQGFVGLVNLTSLDISYNNIEILNSQMIDSLKNLHALNISGNKELDLNELENVFESVEDLRTLSLANIGKEFPRDIFLPLMQMSFLNLSGNGLDAVTLQVLNRIHEIEFIDLSNNNIEGIDEKMAKKFENYQDVRLSDNPIVCDQCHMGQIMKRIENMKYNWTEYPLCYYPENYRGLKLKVANVSGLELCYQVTQIRDQTQRAGPPVGEHPGGYILFGAATIIGVIFLTSCILTSRHGAKYYTHEDRMDDLEKNIDQISINGGKEINFKFPLDDGITRADDVCLPSPTVPISTPILNLSNNNNISKNNTKNVIKS